MAAVVVQSPSTTVAAAQHVTSACALASAPHCATCRLLRSGACCQCPGLQRWAGCGWAANRGLPPCQLLLQGPSTDHSLAAWLQHLREQFDSLRPLLQALLQAYPGLLQPEWLTWEAFLWAVECWYAYAIEVSDRLQRCAALLACLNTHSTAM